MTHRSFILSLKFLIYFVLATTPLFAGLLEKENQLYKQRKLSQSLVYYNKALAVGENSVMVQFNKANTLFKLGQTGRALVIYENLIESTAQVVRPYLNAGGVYFQMNEIGHVRIFYLQAHKGNPQNLTAIKMVGEC